MEHRAVLYASFWRRLAAAAIEVLLVTVLANMVAFVIGFALTLYLTVIDEADERVLGSLIAGFSFMGTWVCHCLYSTLLESSGRQATVGKGILGLRVTDLGGHRISWARANGRFWAKYLSALPLFAGFLMALFTARHQALHDHIAGCFVVTRTEGSSGRALDGPPAA